MNKILISLVLLGIIGCSGSKVTIPDNREDRGRAFEDIMHRAEQFIQKQKDKESVSG